MITLPLKLHPTDKEIITFFVIFNSENMERMKKYDAATFRMYKDWPEGYDKSKIEEIVFMHATIEEEQEIIKHAQAGNFIGILAMLKNLDRGRVNLPQDNDPVVRYHLNS